MSGCLDFETLQSAASAAPLPAAQREHVAGCRRCSRVLADLRDLAPLLGELSRASEQSGAAGARASLWPKVAARLERPGLADRLPVPVVTVGRILGEMLRPAAVATAAAGIAGLLLGGWLAVASRSSVRADETNPYTVSSLVDDSGGGLSSTYDQSLEADNDAATPDGVGPAVPTNPGTTGKSAPSGNPVMPGPSPKNTPSKRTPQAPNLDSTRAGGRS